MLSELVNQRKDGAIDNRHHKLWEERREEASMSYCTLSWLSLSPVFASALLAFIRSSLDLQQRRSLEGMRPLSCSVLNKAEEGRRRVYIRATIRFSIRSILSLKVHEFVSSFFSLPYLQEGNNDYELWFFDLA